MYGDPLQKLVKAKVAAEVLFERLVGGKLSWGSKLLSDKLISSFGKFANEVNTNITTQQGKRVAYVNFLGIFKQSLWGTTAARLIVSNASDVNLFFTERLSEKTNVKCSDYAKGLGLDLVDGENLYNLSFERLEKALKDPTKVIILNYPVIQSILSNYSSLKLSVFNWSIYEFPREDGIFAKVTMHKEDWIRELDGVKWGISLRTQPISYASQGGDLDKVKTLLRENPELVNLKDIRGLSPLINAVNNGHVEVVKLLLNEGADINVLYAGGNTALHLAALKNQVEVVKLLIDNGAKIKTKNKEGLTALQEAEKKGYAEIVELFPKSKWWFW